MRKLSLTWPSVTSADRRLLLAIMLVHALLTVWFVSRQGFNADETEYFGYVIRWAHGNMERIKPTDDSKSPMALPSTIIVPFKKFFDLTNDPYGHILMRWGRLGMYGYFLLGAAFMFLLCYRLFGNRWWALPFGFYVFDPTVFTYAAQVGTDMACAGFVLAAVYTLWRYTQTLERRYLLVCGLAVAFGLLTKASLIYLLFFTVAYYAVWLLVQKQHFIRKPLLQWVKHMALLALMCLFIINAGYQFKDMFYPVNDMPHDSAGFMKLREKLTPIHNLPVPLSYYYVSGFDRLSHSKEKGGGPEADYTFNGVNVLGNYYDRGPVWYYYLAVLPFKLPLLTILLLGLSAFIIARSRIVSFIAQHHLFILAALFFFITASLTNPFQIGIRHILMVFPFLYLATMPAIKWMHGRKPGLLRIGIIIQVVSLITFWPNMLAYTSEWFWPKQYIYRYINDTSVSYQHVDDLPQRFIKNNPEYSLPPKKPAAGKFAVLMEELAAPDNVFGYEWLYRNFLPQAHFMHNVAIFTVTEKDLREKAEGLKQYR